MKRFLSILLVCIALFALCTMNASAAAKKVSFNPDKIQKCMMLNDQEPVDGKGHCSMMLVDENGYGRWYTFQQNGLWKQVVTPTQMTKFLAEGRIPVTPSQFQFDRIVEFPVSAEEGRRMYDYAETHEFLPFHMNASFWKPVGIIIGDNCTTFVHDTFAEGSRKYKFLYPFGVPNYTVTTLKWRLAMRGIKYTMYTPVDPRAVKAAEEVATQQPA